MFSFNFEGKIFSISPWFWPRSHRGCRTNWRHLQKMSFSRIWMVFGSFPVCIRRVRSTKIAQNVCFWGFPYIYSQPRRYFGGVGPLHTMGFENPRRNRIREGRFGKVSISLDRVQVFRAKKIFERTRKNQKISFFECFRTFRATAPPESTHQRVKRAKCHRMCIFWWRAAIATWEIIKNRPKSWKSTFFEGVFNSASNYAVRPGHPFPSQIKEAIWGQLIALIRRNAAKCLNKAVEKSCENESISKKCSSRDLGPP